MRRDVITAPVMSGKQHASRVQFSTTTTPAYFGQVSAAFIMLLDSSSFNVLLTGCRLTVVSTRDDAGVTGRVVREARQV